MTTCRPAILYTGVQAAAGGVLLVALALLIHGVTFSANNADQWLPSSRLFPLGQFKLERSAGSWQGAQGAASELADLAAKSEDQVAEALSWWQSGRKFTGMPPAWRHTGHQEFPNTAGCCKLRFLHTAVRMHTLTAVPCFCGVVCQVSQMITHACCGSRVHIHQSRLAHQRPHVVLCRSSRRPAVPSAAARELHHVRAGLRRPQQPAHPGPDCTFTPGPDRARQPLLRPHAGRSGEDLLFHEDAVLTRLCVDAERVSISAPKFAASHHPVNAVFDIANPVAHMAES